MRQEDDDPRPVPALSRGCLWTLLAGGFVLSGSLALILLWFHRAGEPVSRGRLQAARARWRSSGIRNYSMELNKAGAVTEHQRVEVRDGGVTLLRPDGTAMHPRDPSYYTVEGLFRTIEEESAAAAHPEQMGLPAGSAVVLRMHIDPRYGYPDEFRRLVLGVSGRDIIVRVGAFRPLAAGAGKP